MNGREDKEIRMGEVRTLRDCVTRWTHSTARRGFTLIELLVVIGIIVSLIAITIPAVLKARNTGAITAQKLEFQSIEAGLIAYKQDFQEFPTVLYQDSGSEVLGQALLGPGPAQLINPNPAPPFQVNQFYGTALGPYYVCLQVTNNMPTAGDPAWQELTIPYSDMHEGFGVSARAQGKVFGPYLDASKFKMKGLQILDHWGNPILYFPANATKPGFTGKNVSYNSGKLATYQYLGQTATAQDPSNVGNGINSGGRGRKSSFTSLIDAGDNISSFLRMNPPLSEPMIPVPNNQPAINPAYKRIAVLLGDYDPSLPPSDTKQYNGIIDPNEHAANIENFILWSAGPDGVYGIADSLPPRSPIPASLAPTADEIRKCDDVTNIAP